MVFYREPFTPFISFILTRTIFIIILSLQQDEILFIFHACQYYCIYEAFKLSMILFFICCNEFFMFSLHSSFYLTIINSCLTNCSNRSIGKILHLGIANVLSNSYVNKDTTDTLKQDRYFYIFIVVYTF